MVTGTREVMGSLFGHGMECIPCLIMLSVDVIIVMIPGLQDPITVITMITDVTDGVQVQMSAGIII